MTERELTALLERATSGLDPAVDTLVARGAARGRRTLRRRRGTIAVAVVAIGGVFVGGSVALTGASDEGRGLDVTAPTPPADARDIDTDGDGKPDAWVTATLRPVDAVHRDLRRILGDEAGPLLRGSYRPIVLGATDDDPEGTDVAWWFRYEGTLTQVNVQATSMTCDGYTDVFVDPPACATHDGIPVAVHAPDQTNPKYHEITRPVEAWQEGYVIRLIATTTDERGPQHRTRAVTDEPPIPVEAMIELVTSDIWFEE